MCDSYGAPSAHWLGFKSGGVRGVEESYSKLKSKRDVTKKQASVVQQGCPPPVTHAHVPPLTFMPIIHY